jgi:hypothetical protein
MLKEWGRTLDVTTTGVGLDQKVFRLHGGADAVPQRLGDLCQRRPQLARFQRRC